jgi:hypothetical protein
MGSVKRLFFVRTKATNRIDGFTSPTDDTKPTPAFLTLQSLATFPGAALGVTIIWRFFDWAFGVDHRAVPIVASFVVAGVIYIAGYSSDWQRRDKFLAGFIATLNGMYLAMSVVGIDIGLGEAGWTQVGGAVG